MRPFSIPLTLLLYLAVAGLSPRTQGSPYDDVVVGDKPVLYLPLSKPQGTASEPDSSGNGLHGRYYPNTSPAKATMPNGDKATVFDGYTQYVEVRSHRFLSIRRGGALTLEAWIRPDTLEFPSDQGDGYVHWAGKGEPSNHEYALRMYSKTNSSNRPNRISGYAFNLNGGLGSGSYFQDPVRPGEWIHVAVIIQTRTRPGTVKIYKNGVLRDTTPLSQFDVTPQAGSAPLRIATRDMASFFKGAIGKLAVYAYALSEADLTAHILNMR